MKSFFALVFASIVLSACASVGVATQDQHPARDRDQKCIGGGLDRNVCMQFANQRCSGGFEVFEKDATEEDGVVRRAYYFKCLL